MTKYFSKACRFAVYDPTSLRSPSLRSPSLRFTMESVHLVKQLKKLPIVVVASGEGMLGHHYTFTGRAGIINIKDDIVEPLFSPGTPQLADNPKIFLFIVSHGLISDYSSIQKIIPAIGGNYIVGAIISDDNIYPVTPAILSALESSQESVQWIFKSLKRVIDRPPSVHMTVIDHLNEPVYLHPDVPQGTHSEPGKPHTIHNTSHTHSPHRT